MPRSRTVLFAAALVAFAIAAPNALAGVCTYDYDFTPWPGDQLLISVSVSCPAAVGTTILRTGGPPPSIESGPYADKIVPNPAGGQTFCASANAFYYGGSGGSLIKDTGDGDTCEVH
jgi:hypothetical protein